jgi:hypothetical protein
MRAGLFIFGTAETLMKIDGGEDQNRSEATAGI